MDQKNIQSILQEALEQEIPSAQIDLLSNVKERLVAGATQQGEKMNLTKSRRISHLAFASVMILALLVVAFVTPQGRAFAQSVLQFFRRSDSYVLPLPPEQIAPTPSGVEPTAQPPTPPVSIEEAEALAGFDAKELPSTPTGFVFAGAMAGKGGMSIQYQAQGGGGALIINESTQGFMESEWDQAPVEYITPATIGKLDAEIVQGAYVVYPGETVAQWNPEAAIIRLRWIEDGIWFEMAKFGGVESVAYLDKDGLIALAESMVYKPGVNQSVPTQHAIIPEVSQPASDVDHVMLSNVDDAKGIANFNVKIVPVTPEGMIFDSVTATPGSVNLRYKSNAEGAGTLSIGESLGDENWE